MKNAGKDTERVVYRLKTYFHFIIILLLWHAVPYSPEASGPEELPAIQIVTSEFAPFNYIENGMSKGFSTEIVHMLLDALKIRSPIATLPWARAYQTALRQENTLIFTIARTPDREKLFHWVGILVTGQSYLFSLRDRHLSLTGLDDARHLRIGATRNDIRVRFLNDRGFLGLDLAVNSGMNATKLLNQRIDLWAEDELAAVHAIRRLGYDPGDVLVKALPLDIQPRPTGYLAFSRHTPDHVVDRFKSAFSKLKHTDGYRAVQSRYLHPGIPQN